MPPHLKKSINQAHFEKATSEQIVSHLGRELELNGLEAPDELQINTVTQHATKPMAEKLKSTCHICRQPATTVNSNERTSKLKTTQIKMTITVTTTVVKQTLTAAPTNKNWTKKNIVEPSADQNIHCRPTRTEVCKSELH